MGEQQVQCQLFGWFGVLVQLMLGLLSFAVLIFKRYKQHPKRAWRIWCLDTSKQAVSQLLAHFLNVAISLSLSKKQQNDPCLWYCATIVLDCSVGMLLCVGLLRMLELSLFKGSRAKYQSGNYYEVIHIDESLITHGDMVDPQGKMQPLQVTERRKKIIINFTTWLIQFLIWNAIVISVKSILFAIQDVLSGPIMIVTEFLMGWITSYPKLQLVVVMFIIPVIMNAIAFWIQDNYLMKKEPKDEADRRTVTTASAHDSDHHSDTDYQKVNELL